MGAPIDRPPREHFGPVWVWPYTEPMTWWEYVVRHAGTENQSEIARRIGRDQSSLNKWPQGAKPRVESVRAFAEAYGRPVLEAFVAAGILSEEEARQGL